MDKILAAPNNLRPLLRTSYHGGRTAVYDVNIFEYSAIYANGIITPTVQIDDYLYYLDINSSYPNIMLEDLPNGEIEFVFTPLKVWEMKDNNLQHEKFQPLNLYSVVKF